MLEDKDWQRKQLEELAEAERQENERTGTPEGSPLQDFAQNILKKWSLIHEK